MGGEGFRRTARLGEGASVELDTSLGAIEAPDAANGATSVTTKWSSGDKNDRYTVVHYEPVRVAAGDYVRLGHPTDGQVFRVKSGELVMIH